MHTYYLSSMTHNCRGRPKDIFQNHQRTLLWGWWFENTWDEYNEVRTRALSTSYEGYVQKSRDCTIQHPAWRAGWKLRKGRPLSLCPAPVQWCRGEGETKSSGMWPKKWTLLLKQCGIPCPRTLWKTVEIFGVSG